MNFIRRNPKIGVQVEELTRVNVNETDAKTILDKLCKEYGESVKSGRMPHVVLDATLTGVSSETVKSFTSALAIPTVSMSYGQEYDIRAWRNLDKEDEKYLIHIMPPGDLIPEVVRSLVLAQNISNAAILFDDSFVMDHKYKSLLQNVPTRHVISPVENSKTIKKQLTKMIDLDVVNFFILGRMSTIKMVLDHANINKYFGKKYSWHAITKDKESIKCSCTNATVLFLRPEPDPDSRDRLGKLQSTYSLTFEPEISSAFYFEVIFRTLMSVKKMLDDGEWPRKMEFVLCEDFNENKVPKRTNLDLRKALQDYNDPPFYAPLIIDKNGYSFMEFNVKIEKATIINSQTVSAEDMGEWKASLNGQIKIKDPTSLSNFSSVTVYKVVTVIQHPFIYYDPDSKDKDNPYSGYCIDLLEEIRKLIKFDYVIYEAPDKKFGTMDDKGQWNGMIKELIEKRADIGLGSLSIMAERENVIDFTVPYYDLVGITILMKKTKTPTSLFKFLTVLENDVWFCILAAYFFTSFLMWIFDKWSPYSYQNNREKYKDDEEKREFNLKECLWFCMTSLTPQGGGEAPKNLSGRLVAATWWLFGFIIIASYTANLAAFLTVSRLDTPVESLDDLSKQYKIQYAPINGSSAMTYFERMADIETRFYEIWKDMSLNDSLSEVERAKLAVWDYPVSDKYTKMWQAMKEAGLPQTFDEALERVKNSTSSSEGFAFLGDATDIRYQFLTTCDFQIVGEEFSRKPYGIAVQQGSPLKDQFNNAILQLLNKRRLEKLKEKWWTNNPKKMICEKHDEQSDGISIENIGGVFIVIFVGIGMACVTLAFEYWWYKYKKNPRIEATNEKENQRKINTWNTQDRFGPDFKDYYTRNAFQTRPGRFKDLNSLAKIET
ncbi:glutamate receptor, putative [Pediculus humanus corporis]|uniref:Glutamate receptor, putative n=1 Tax=Pediculus humanus subsp. corporis TaxID=121224 RepID=E0VBE7_PEDHC|nr:glutamate receptor, putative [Pediculus humanus corporis]EEB10703.1 glutamate receptor, putative [Pediculus humanus corporis]